jgi:hypothetical protein
MFISEPREAYANGIYEFDIKDVHESNSCFVNEVKKRLHLPIKRIYDELMKGPYRQLSKVNPIAAFNYARLYLHLPVNSESGPR